MMKLVPKHRYAGALAATRRRTVLHAAAALSLGGALGGCAPPEPPLRLGSIVFPGYEFVFLAREKGWLDERQVRLIELLSNTDALRALASGQLEAAMLTLDEMLSAQADGLDLCAVLILDVSAGADAVLAHPPLTLKELAGRRIAVEDSAGGAIMLSALLAAAGLRIEQVRKESFTLDRSIEFYRQRRVDFIISVEPWVSQLERLGARRIFDSARIPGRIVDVLAVRRGVLDSHADAVRQLVAAHFRALAHWRSQPEEAQRLLAARLRLGPSEVSTAYKGLEMLDVADNRAWMQRDGQLTRVLQELQPAMQQDALLQRAFGLAEVADSSFLPPGR